MEFKVWNVFVEQTEIRSWSTEGNSESELLLSFIFVKWLGISKATNRVTSNTTTAVRMACHTSIDILSKE